MGYVMFGLSLFPSAPIVGTLAITAAITGTVLHLVNHAVSKGLLFLSAGAIMHQTEIRDIREMGGLAGEMPFTAVASTTAALSIGGTPPFACFISEVLIFVGAFEVITNDGFLLLPTALMLVATVISLAYSLRYLSHIFFGQAKSEVKKKVMDAPNYMKAAMAILVVLVIVLGFWPTFFIHLIQTVQII
jgi:NADH:ubiquinone oxidoreductase subunit 5 (subunit L)/multisubunit Na+/H+ antiporter MnhA subunit